MSVDDLRANAREALSSVLDGARAVGLVNFPNHGNPGDPGLWLGTRALLRDLGVRVAYQANPESLDLDVLDRVLGDAPVLINGGGNFGDLYGRQQGARMRLFEHHRRGPIVQLPQSVRFRDPANAEPVADAVAGRDIRIMVRDHASQEAVRQLLKVEPVLSPDHAFGLGGLRRTRSVDREVLWMTWDPSMPEATPESILADPPDWVHTVDWFTGAATAHEDFDARGRLAWHVNRSLSVRGSALGSQWPMLAATFAPLARRWWARGLDILSSAGVLVTNKLHGHIAATLMGIPHVVLDNEYGKVLGAVEAWTSSLPGVYVATDADEALAVADKLRRSS